MATTRTQAPDPAGTKLQPEDSRPILDLARQAAAAGLSVVPPLQDGTKRPDGTWKTYQTTAPSNDQLDAWYADGGRTGIGLVCGAVSGHLEMLEFEGRASDLWRTYVHTCAEHGLEQLLDRVIAGYVEKTPSGGLHLLYRCTEPIDGNQKLARRPGPDGTIEVLIETRGEGGYVVVAPSNGGVHPTGGRWELLKGGFDTITVITPAERADLLDCARLLDEMPAPTPVAPPAGAPTNRPRSLQPDSWMDAVVADFNAATSWAQILTPAGWQHHHRGGEIDYWTRPGKEQRDGHSATTNANGTDRLIVFSSSVAGFDTADGTGPSPSFDRFGAWAVIHHGGDRLRAAKEASRAGYGPTWEPTERPRFDDLLPDDPAPPVEVEEPVRPHGPIPIDWTSFWVREHIGEDWLVHPILPRGRQVALWARHKTGKSLLTIEIAAALATGRGCLSQPPAEPIDVIYFDMEMTEDDLHERLTDLGYGPADDLTRLHYYLLPSLAPLDKPEGGAMVVNLATIHNAKAIVLDTMARVVTGDENDADTYRAFYRYTGLELKAMGVTVLRLDHGGKDPTKGQRGSSGKGDDVDVVWQLRPAESGLELIRDVARMSWIPDRVALLRNTDPLRHVVTSGGLWPAGTAAVATEMQRLGITHEMPQREALKAFRDAGGEGKTDVLRAGLRYLKELAEREAEQWMADQDDEDF